MNTVHAFGSTWARNFCFANQLNRPIEDYLNTIPEKMFLTLKKSATSTAASEPDMNGDEVNWVKGPYIT